MVTLHLPRDPKAAYAMKVWAKERGITLLPPKPGRRSDYVSVGYLRNPNGGSRVYPSECRNGHALLSEKDERIVPTKKASGDYYTCRQCIRISRNAYKARRKAAGLPV